MTFLTLTPMEMLTLSNLDHAPQRYLACAEPLQHLEVLGLIVPKDGHDWRLYEITPAGRRMLTMEPPPL